jgi:hypothetical protein
MSLLIGLPLKMEAIFRGRPLGSQTYVNKAITNFMAHLSLILTPHYI